MVLLFGFPSLQGMLDKALEYTTGQLSNYGVLVVFDQ